MAGQLLLSVAKQLQRENQRLLESVIGIRALPKALAALGVDPSAPSAQAVAYMVASGALPFDKAVNLVAKMEVTRLNLLNSTLRLYDRAIMMRRHQIGLVRDAYGTAKQMIQDWFSPMEDLIKTRLDYLLKDERMTLSVLNTIQNNPMGEVALGKDVAQKLGRLDAARKLQAETYLTVYGLLQRAKAKALRQLSEDAPSLQEGIVAKAPTYAYGSLLEEMDATANIGWFARNMGIPTQNPAKLKALGLYGWQVLSELMEGQLGAEEWVELAKRFLGEHLKLIGDGKSAYFPSQTSKGFEAAASAHVLQEQAKLQNPAKTAVDVVEWLRTNPILTKEISDVVRELKIGLAGELSNLSPKQLRRSEGWQTETP